MGRNLYRLIIGPAGNILTEHFIRDYKMPMHPSKMFYRNLTNLTILFQEEKDILLRSENFVLTLSN